MVKFLDLLKPDVTVVKDSMSSYDQLSALTTHTSILIPLIAVFSITLILLLLLGLKSVGKRMLISYPQYLMVFVVWLIAIILTIIFLFTPIQLLIN